MVEDKGDKNLRSLTGRIGELALREIGSRILRKRWIGILYSDMIVGCWWGCLLVLVGSLLGEVVGFLCPSCGIVNAVGVQRRSGIIFKN